MKFSDLGVDNLKDSSTFKKIQYFSKSNPQKLYNNLDEFSLKYKKISDLYLSDNEHLSTSNYAIKRQHNYTSKNSLLNNSNTLLDPKSINTMLSYNYNLKPDLNLNHSLNNFKSHNRKTSLFSSANTPILNAKLNQFGNIKANTDLLPYLSFLDKNALLSSENDSTQVNNPLKYALNNK
jgi:hypothetical protein